MNTSPHRGWVARLLLPAILSAPVLAQPAANEAVRQAMRRGAEAMTSESFDQAAMAYAAVTRMQPGFAEAYFNLGLAEERTGQMDKARADLEKAVGLKPSLRGANLFLGTIAYRQNRYKDAETNLLRETRLDPHSAKAFMWLGVCFLAEDQPEAAVAPLDTAHRLDPSDIDTLYHRGRAYLLVANASYAAMFKFDPDSLRVHQVLAEADAQAFRTADAITQYEIAVKLAPKQSGLRESLADQYWVSGNLDKAEEAYKTELEIDPANTSARFKLGCLNVKRGNSADGVALLEQALRDEPSLSDAHYYLGNALFDLDRDEEATRQYELAIAADPEDDRSISSYYRLSQVYRKMHRMDDSRKALENYQELKARGQAHLATRRAQIASRRFQLPVEDSDPEKGQGPVDN